MNYSLEDAEYIAVERVYFRKLLRQVDSSKVEFSRFWFA